MMTDSNHDFGYSPNLLRKLGEPDRCDQAWVADTTYLRTDATLQELWICVVEESSVGACLPRTTAL